MPMQLALAHLMAQDKYKGESSSGQIDTGWGGFFVEVEVIVKF